MKKKIKLAISKILAALGLMGLIAIVILAIIPEPPKPFTAQAYEDICKELNNERYEVVTAQQYFTNEDTYKTKWIYYPNITNPLPDGSTQAYAEIIHYPKIIVILTHESDHQLYDFASIEKKYGLRSTLLVRPYGDTKTSDYFTSNNILQLIQWQAEGWEIGYHYDALSKANWNLYNATSIVHTQLPNGTYTTEKETLPLRDSLDYDKALQLFRYELNVMKPNFNIYTISAHRDIAAKTLIFQDGVPENFTLPQNGHILPLADGGEAIFIDRSDIDNHWLAEKQRDIIKGELGLRDLSEIRYNVLLSDEGGEWPIGWMQTLREAQIGDIVLISLGSDWWK